MWGDINVASTMDDKPNREYHRYGTMGFLLINNIIAMI
jgi:hypothetical protein